MRNHSAQHQKGSFLWRPGSNSEECLPHWAFSRCNERVTDADYLRGRLRAIGEGRQNTFEPELHHGSRETDDLCTSVGLGVARFLRMGCLFISGERVTHQIDTPWPMGVNRCA